MPARNVILTILILMFLCTPVHAPNFQHEEIWIHHGTFDLAIGERAHAEHYTVKVHDIQTEGTDHSASLLIYLSNNYKEIFFADALANNEHVYDDELKIITTGIAEGKVSIELYTHEYEKVWILDINRTKLGVGEILDITDATILVSGIEGNNVTLEMNIDDLSTTEIYTQGVARKYSDQFMMRIAYVDSNTEKAIIEIYRPGIPELLISITDIKDIYNQDEDIKFKAFVENTGTLPVRGVTVTASSSSGCLEETYQTVPIIGAFSDLRFPLSIVPPTTPTGETIMLNARVEGYDYKGNPYSNSTIREIYVNPYLSIAKTVEHEQIALESTDDRPGKLKVHLTITNNGDLDTIIHVHDQVPASFLHSSMPSLDWSFVLRAYSSEDITYIAIPTRAGIFELDPAVVTWDTSGGTYRISSGGLSNISVEGTRLVVEKIVDRDYAFVGESIEITILIHNEGTRNVNISVSDSLPQQVQLIEGETGWNGHLPSQETIELTYTAEVLQERNLELPAAEVRYKDGMGKTGVVRSSPLILHAYENIVETPGDGEMITDETSVTGPTRWGMTTFLISSFITLFCVLSIVPVTLYLYINRIR
ncbi:MAG: COG1361 family protein [Methanosarcinaceae archaeon]